ncbi:MAG: glycosyltransferase family protein [Thermosynechococcaceae cyanobacterium]
MRLMVYSHDAYGLGNLRRMLAICEHLLNHWPHLSILLVSGSPMIHGFCLPAGLDYIKLPCLNRGVSGELSAKYLKITPEETIAFRSQLILSAAKHFKPDLLLVDKKPYGIQQELALTLKYIERRLPQSKCVLLLRDILDAPEKVCQEWQSQGYYQAIQSHYDQVLVVGMPEIFDLAQAYQFPLPVARKVRYCGYIRKTSDRPQRSEIRRFLQLSPTDQLVLVTPGGGEDGFPLIDAYLQGLQTLDPAVQLRSLILCGPEMPASQQETLQKMVASNPAIELQVFTDNLLGYLDAADVVVSMGGYNTLTEILSLRKRTVVIPRTSPSHEQLIRTERFQQWGLVQSIHPQVLTPQLLIQRVLEQLCQPALAQTLNFEGLPQIAHHLSELVAPSPAPACFLTDLLTV